MPKTKTGSSKCALLIVDMTNDFLLRSYNESLALERGLNLIPRIRSLQNAFMKSNHPVIYSTDRHLKSDFELKRWGPHSMKGTDGSKIVDGLLPNEPRIQIMQRGWKLTDVSKVKKSDLLFEVEKGTYSGFSDNGGRPTALDALLRRLGIKPEDKLFITGLHTNCCDKHTAADAFFRGYRLVMVSDCVAAFDDPEGKMGLPNEKALIYERYWYNAEISSSRRVIRSLEE
jgi:nicotinamidase-related amidase